MSLLDRDFFVVAPWCGSCSPQSSFAAHELLPPCGWCRWLVQWLYRDVFKLVALFSLLKCACCRGTPARRRPKTPATHRPVPNLLTDRELERVFGALSSASG